MSKSLLPKELREIPEKYIATKEVRDERLKLCLGCEDLTMLWQCKHCYCFVHLKTYLKNEHCEKPKPEERKWEVSTGDL